MDLVQDLVHNFILMEINVHEAKTNFSKLLQRVALGEEVILAEAGVRLRSSYRYDLHKASAPWGFLKERYGWRKTLMLLYPRTFSLGSLEKKSLPSNRSRKPTAPKASTRGHEILIRHGSFSVEC